MRAEAFKAGRPERAKAEPYCIVIPPPNVTGSLHMGHALNNTLQDVLCRFERMRGKDVLWQPGTDHAGIATQMVVERQLMERQEPDRRKIGREKFIEKVWAWKAESGGTIVNQLQAAGRLVRLVPRALHHGRGPVEGRPQGVRRSLQPDGADLQGQAPRQLGPGVPERHLRPRSRDGRGQGAFSGRRRSETFDAKALGRCSTAIRTGTSITSVSAEGRSVAASSSSPPRGPRRCWATRRSPCIPRTSATRTWSARRCVLPLVGREIPIVADEYSDPEKGSGAVKITPAHDFNDYRGRQAAPRDRLDQHLRRQGAAQRRGAGEVSRARSLRGAQACRRRPGGAGPRREDRAARARRAARPARQCRHRAVADRPVVRQRGRAGQAGHRRGRERQDQVRAEELGEDLLRVDAQHPAVVHLAPALVGAPDPGVVWAGRQDVRRIRRGVAPQSCGKGVATRRTVCAEARRGRARHVVLVGAVAVLDAGLAGRDQGAEALLPDQRARHRLRHHLLLGRAHDDDGPALHEGGAVPRRLHPRPGARREGRRRCRRPRATSWTPWA